MVSQPAAYLTASDNFTMDNSKKTPLQLLAQTCNSIGLPDPPSKSKSILPLNETSSKGSGTHKHSSSSDSAKSGSVKVSPHFCRSPAESESAKKSEKRFSPTSTSPSVNGGLDYDGHCSPKRDHEGSRVTPLGHSSSVGQALPPTLPPTGVAPKCGGCVTPYPTSILGSYPPMPQTSGVLPYSQGMPAPPGAYSASLHAAAAAAASMPPFVTACREPYCRVCPPSAGGFGLGNGSSGMGAQLNGGGRCPLGCLHCTPSAHELFWLSAAASHPFLAAGGGFPGLPSLPNPAVSMAGLPFASLYNHSAFAAAALAVNSATSPLPSASAVGPFTHASTAPGTVTSTTSSFGQSNNSMPFSCSWGTGDTLCGKRFAIADELREHLSSHVVNTQSENGGSRSPETRTAPRPASSAPVFPTVTTGPATNHLSDVVSSSSSNPVLPPPPSVNIPPIASLPPLPSPLGRPYSPRSMLALASFNMNHRYHPYGKNPMGSLMPSGGSSLGAGPLSHLSFPGLNAAALGYASLYGQRLPGSLPHP